MELARRLDAALLEHNALQEEIARLRWEHAAAVARANAVASAGSPTASATPAKPAAGAMNVTWFCVCVCGCVLWTEDPWVCGGVSVSPHFVPWSALSSALRDRLLSHS